MSIESNELTEPLKLEIGKMKTTELAEWFGVAYSTFRKHSAKYYEELINYCQYTKIYGGIEIQEIYKPIYIKLNSYTTLETIIKEIWPRE